MKKLNLLDQSTSFKVNDTGTVIPFNAFENNQPFGVTENETSVFRIKNDMGFLKSVNATSTASGYIFQLNTKDLVGLVPGTYEIELTVTDTQTNEELIFPDTGFCSFSIANSALTVTGTQIPTMSLDSFKQQLEQYVQTQTNGKLESIKSDFDDYVANVKQGPTGPQGEPGPDGKSASIIVGSTTTGDVGSSASVTNSGTSSAAILNFTIPQGKQGPQGNPGSDGKAATVTVGTTKTTDSGQSASVTNSGTDSAAILDFVLPAGQRGPIGETGPEGTIGDYVTGTGWLDLTPYMDTSNVYVSGGIYRAQYCIETINGEISFKWRIHARIQDSSKLGSWGQIKLFDVSSVVTNYGGWESNQYSTTNGDLSHGGMFAVETINDGKGHYYVQNRCNLITTNSTQTGQASIQSNGIVSLG